ncbi:hypothetical protein G6514_008953 [Epicoccum nigrum]|nr:hypothetical protein G6514_008953 [Epicoccum nigrum]
MPIISPESNSTEFLVFHVNTFVLVDTSRLLTVVTALAVTLINISVFVIWIPARLQISNDWIHINNIWDRIEKVLYLLIDGFLNFYFMRVVRANLVKNGLKKYKKLVLFNKYMIVISLLMDVMIIAAMWIPNGYAIFHPLAYLVKLNIEMSMAHLIKKIATDHSRLSDTFIVSNPPSSAGKKCSSQDPDQSTSSRQTISILKGVFGYERSKPTSTKNEILRTEEFRVQSGQIPDLEMQQSNQRTQLDIHDGLDPASNESSLTWTNSGDYGSNESEQDTSSVSNLRGTATISDKRHIARPLPAVLHPM